MNSITLPFIACLTAICFSCNQGPDYRSIQETTEINPVFERTPPLATNFYIRRLDPVDDHGNNVVYSAKFPPESIDGPYLAVMVGEEKVVMRDDGHGADQTAGDDIFSWATHIDLDELQEQLGAGLRNIELWDTIPRFSGRTIIPRGPRPPRIDLEDFLNRELFEIPHDFFIPPPSFFVRPEKTLMITSTDVVEDPQRTFNPCTAQGNPNGVWTFGFLMRQLASPDPASIATDAQASAFVRDWLSSWLTTDVINSDDIPARSDIQDLISDWESKSGVNPGGILRMEFAPFKLLAIVNRMDLRGNSGYGFSNAGEGRFVFSALSNNCNSLQFTVIFEYGLHLFSCSSVRGMAQQWLDLNNHDVGSSQYNSALENITQQFTLSGTNPSKPNQSSLNQIRTNEIALDAPWELREFNLESSGLLEHTTVKQEPAVIFNAKSNNFESLILASYVNTHSTSIASNTHDVPLLWQHGPDTMAFLGGKSHVTNFPLAPAPNAHHWNGDPSPASPAFISDDEARHVFSLNTCSGCHGGETRTRFTHIDPSSFGTEATLSGFLTGISVPDAADRPSGTPTIRLFNDLARRRVDLVNLTNQSCSPPFFFSELHRIFTFDPIRMTH